MAKVEKEVTINAPLEEVFNYVKEPSNLPELCPSLIEVRDVQSLPKGGCDGKWVYKMAGIRFEGKGKHVEIVPNQWIVMKTEGGVNSLMTWTFRSRGDTTRVTLTIEYKVPVPLLGKLAEAIIVKMNDQEGDLMMANLQARFMTANH